MFWPLPIVTVILWLLSRGMNEQARDRLLLSYVIAVAFFALYQIIFNDTPKRIAPHSIVYNPNITGLVMLCGLFVALKRRDYLLTTSFVFVLLLSNARSVLIAGALALSVYLWSTGQLRAKQGIIIGGVCLLLVCFGMAIAERNMIKMIGTRFDLWKVALTDTRSILWGNGLGSWAGTGIQMMKENGEPEWWSWAHNDWLQYLFEQGVLGCIFLYAYIKNFVKNVDFYDVEQRIMFACFIALAICAFFHFPFRIGRLAGISIVILALMEAHTTGIKHEKTDYNSRNFLS